MNSQIPEGVSPTHALPIGFVDCSRKGGSQHYVIDSVDEQALDLLGLSGAAPSFAPLAGMLGLEKLEAASFPCSYTIVVQSLESELEVTAFIREAGQSVSLLLHPLAPLVDEGAIQYAANLRFVLDADYQVVRITGNALEQQMARSPQKIIGRSFPELFPPPVTQAFRTALERSCLVRTRQTLVQRSPLPDDNRYFRFVLEWDASNATYLISIEDITASVQSVLAQGEGRQEGTIIIDEQHIIRFIDAQSRRILEYPFQPLEGTDVRTLFSVPHHTSIVQIPYVGPNQVMKNVSLTIAPLELADAPGHSVLRISEANESQPKGLQNTVFLNLLLEWVYQLLQAPLEDTDGVLFRMLESLGKFSDCSRAYICTYTAGETEFSCTHAWCREFGSCRDCIPSAQLPLWHATLAEGKEIYILSAENLGEAWKAERAYLLSGKVQSVLAEPIMQGNVLYGFVCFDTLGHQGNWTEEIRSLLYFFANILGSYAKRIHTEQQLKEAVTKSNTLAQEREEINQALKTFYAKFSHDTRTSLYAISAFSKFLSEGTLSSEQQQYVSQIHANSLFLTNLMRDMLDFSSFSQQTFRLRQVPFCLEDVLYQAQKAVGVLAKEKGLSIAVEYETVIPKRLGGDALRITQILINLLHNAVKFTEEGSIVIRCILLALDRTRIEVELSVEDCGVGMNSDQLQRLFPHKGEVPSPSFASGYGLGLSIVKQLVDAMQGRLTVESEVGRGTRFCCTLGFTLVAEQPPSSAPLLVYWVGTPGPSSEPLRTKLGRVQICPSWSVVPPDAEVLVIEEALLLEAHHHKKGLFPACASFVWTDCFDRSSYLRYRSMLLVRGFLVSGTDLEVQWGELTAKQARIVRFGCSSLSRFAGMRVLIVDDTAVNREILKHRLQSMQVDVDTAKSGEEALRRLEQQDYAVVFLDMRMHGLDGIETAQRIRGMQDERKAKTAVVALSAYLGEEDQMQCRQLGIKDFLLKPVEQDELASVLTTYQAT